MILKCRKLVNHAKLPVKAGSEEAGFDWFAAEDKTLTPIWFANTDVEMFRNSLINSGGKYDERLDALFGLGHCRSKISTGIACQIPKGHYGQFFGRSGLADKWGVAVLGGVIDCTYRGEVKIILMNLGEKELSVKPGDKIAQMVILPVPEITVEEVISLDESERGLNGFGSTGQ